MNSVAQSTKQVNLLNSDEVVARLNPASRARLREFRRSLPYHHHLNVVWIEEYARELLHAQEYEYAADDDESEDGE